MKRAVLLSMLLAGCSVSLDPTTVPCRNDGECPTGSFCSSGKCAAAPASCTSPAVKVGDQCVTPPAMPTGLQATVTSNVSLSWDAATDATSWIVVRDPGGQRFPVTAASFLDTSVTPGASYSYSVIAKNAAGEGPACPAVNATTAPAVPSPTAGLDSPRTGVTLTWPSVTGASAYEVHRGPASGQETLYQTVNDPGTGGNVTFNDPAPFSGLTGYYKVLAKNASGASALSTEAVALTVPAPPATVTASASGTTVTVAWSASTGATGYAVFRGSTNVSGTLPASPRSYNDSPGAGSSAVYTVVAINASGSGPASGGQSATVAPDAPSPNAALDAPKTGIVLTWNRVPGAASYDVYRGTAPGGSKSLLQNVADPGSGTQATFTDTAPDSGVTDYYQVLSKNAGGSSGLSGEVNQTTVPAAPATVTATSTGATVDLAWSASNGATGWAVYRGGTQMGGTRPLSPRTFTDAPPAGSTNTYTVAAINATGTGPASGGQQATVAPTSPALTVSSLSNTGTNTTVNLSWTKPSGATSYEVWRDGDVTPITTVADPGSTYPVQETATGTSFTYHVVAKNAAPGGSTSNLVTATTVPAAPLNLRVTDFATTSVALAWDRSTTAKSYTVTRTNGGNTVTVGTVNDPTATITDLVAQPSTIYSYAVVANDTTGSLTSPASTPAVGTTATPEPTNVTATTVDDTHISVSWDRMTAGVDTYDVLRGATANGQSATPVNGAPIANPGSGSRVTFIDSTAAANTTYFYKVVSNHTASPAQSSGRSFEASARSLYPAPSNLVFKGSGDDNISLSWTSAPGGTYQYEVLRGLVADQYSLVVICDGTGGASEGCTDTGLVQNATYHYRVRVHDAITGNTSLPTNDVQGATTNTFSPDFVTQVLSSTSVQLSINRMPGYDIYDVFQSATSTPAPISSTVPTASITSTSGNGDLQVIANRTVTAGTWFYWVRARWSGSGLSVTPWSSGPQSVTTDPALIAPQNLTVQGLGATQVALKWSPVVGATNYSVTRSPGGSLGTTTSAFFTDTTTSPNTAYSYTVATNGNAVLGSSVGPVTTVSNAATTFNCSAPALVNYYSDGPNQTKVGPPGLRIAPPGVATTPIQSFSDGRCLATGLPATGPIWVRRGQHHFLITGRSLDMSTEVYARADSGNYQSTTPATFNVSGLSPWAANDQVELFGSNNGIAYFALEVGAMSGAPALGDTALNGFTVDLGINFASQIDTAFADKPTLVNVVTLNSSNGVPYQVVAKKLDITSLSSVDGRPVTVSGAFTSVLGSAVSKPIKFLRSQFKAMPTQIGPTGVKADNSDFVAVQASPKDFNGIPHAFSTVSADLLTVVFPAGSTADVDVGNVQVTSPYPASWFTDIDVNFSFTSPTGCGSGNTPIDVGFGGAIIDDATSMFAKAASGLTPALPPVTNPKISADGASFVDAFQPRTGMGTGPSFQWTVPSSLPLPNYIRIFLYEIGVDSTNHRCVFVVGGASTTDQLPFVQLYMPVTAAGTMTMAAMPAGLLVAGHTYVAVIRSVYEPGRNVGTAPQMRGSAEYFTEVVTNTFTP